MKHFLIVMVLLVSACGVTPVWKEYRDDEIGLSFSYPEGMMPPKENCGMFVFSNEKQIGSEKVSDMKFSYCKLGKEAVPDLASVNFGLPAVISDGVLAGKPAKIVVFDKKLNAADYYVELKDGYILKIGYIGYSAYQIEMAEKMIRSVKFY